MKSMWTILCFLPFVSAFITISTSLEPSDVLYMNSKVYVVDDGGGILVMDIDGKNQRYIDIGGDLEAISPSNNGNSYLYVGVESPAQIFRINVNTDRITERITLHKFPNDESSGLESIYYLAKLDVILAGSQANGYVYIYPRINGKFQLYCRFRPYNGANSDLSSISMDGNTIAFLYDSSQQVLFFDTSKISKTNLCSIGAQTNYLKRKYLSLDNMEGIAFSVNHVYIAQDTGNVIRYTKTEFYR